MVPEPSWWMTSGTTGTPLVKRRLAMVSAPPTTPATPTQPGHQVRRGRGRARDGEVDPTGQHDEGLTCRQDPQGGRVEQRRGELVRRDKAGTGKVGRSDEQNQNAGKGERGPVGQRALHRAQALSAGQ